MTDIIETELFLTPTNDRLVMFPIKYPDIWDMYKKSCSAVWFVEEIDFNQDLTDWGKLTENEQYFISMILAFFSSSDGIVNENLCTRFYNEIQIPEARAFYTFQMAIESVHNECYSLMIDTYIKDPKEKHRLLHAVDTIPSVREKADWALKWIEDKEANFATRLVAFAIVEGIFFSGAFCSIYWLKERGVMPGLTFSNELISKDESSHTVFATLIYSHLQHKLSQETIYKILTEAVEIETKFIVESIPCNLLGMNSILMSKYIQFIADRLLLQLGYDKFYNVNNPFPFMDRIGLANSSNFFESRVAEYNRASLVMSDENGKIEFSTEADF
jgi:ribonucleoside-diphosphate reductase beta chain